MNIVAFFALIIVVLASLANAGDLKVTLAIPNYSQIKEKTHLVSRYISTANYNVRFHILHRSRVVFGDSPNTLYLMTEIHGLYGKEVQRTEATGSYVLINKDQDKNIKKTFQVTYPRNQGYSQWVAILDKEQIQNPVNGYIDGDKIAINTTFHYKIVEHDDEFLVLDKFYPVN